MKSILRSASSAAILVGVAGALPAFAQDAGAQPPVDRVAPAETASQPSSEDRVIVTGSFIQGTAVDTALPVEVYTQESLEAQGAPTALEFAKSLSISGPTTGEAYYFSGAQLTGSVNYNLRGLGSDKTLTLLNGRRMSQNTANIPSVAIQRTEILKDGAAVIYGADATGGVVNFITRDEFVGLEAGAQYKYIDGSDGDYGLSIIGGVGDDNVNFMWSAEWEHRSRLSTTDRDFGVMPYAVNPAPYSALTNVASWIPLGARPAVFDRSVYNAGLALSPSRPYAGEFGTPLSGLLRDFTPANCEAVGGTYNPNGVATGTPACMYNYASYYNLVEENDIYRAYAQVNATINENMDFHFDASYGQVVSPQVFGSPAQPVLRGPAVSTGATYQFYVPATNPYAAAFLDSYVGRNSSLGTPFSSGARAATQGLAALTYRAFAHGGNPFLGEGNGFGVPSKVDNQIWRVSSGINGNLGEWAGPLSDVGYDFAITYNQSISYFTQPDIIGYRLQDALAGFGGPNCTLTDDNPNQFGIQNSSVGTSAAAREAFGCYYWNPFASSFANQPVLGLDNPQHVAGAENRADVARWLFDDRAAENINSSLTADLVFNGDSGIALPGGTIGWALGGQIRQSEFRENIQSNLYNGNTPCDQLASQTIGIRPNPAGTSQTTTATPRATTDPLFAGCTLDAGGPFVFFGTNPADYADQQQYSIFGELQVPVLDNLNLQLAVRKEEFSGGLGETVYKVSGKWDVWGPLSLRASYGTNYQAPPAGLIPGDLNNGVNSYTRFSGAWLGSQTLTRSDIVAETAKAWNVGAIWQSQGLAPDHDFRVILDYFDIKTENELGLLASANDIAAGVFRYGVGVAGQASPDENEAFAERNGVSRGGRVDVNDVDGDGNTSELVQDFYDVDGDGNTTELLTDLNTGSAYADCSHPLVLSGRVTFNGGACVQGVTQANALNSTRTDYGNGPGQHIAGIDLQLNYELPLGPGDLTIALTATKVLKDENSASIIDGFAIKPVDDRLGYLNFATVGDASSELRGNLSANYRWDVHNFRLAMNYVQGVDDERGPIQQDGYLPGTTVPVGLNYYGVEGDDWMTFDFTYMFSVTDNLRLTATVANILDKDPPYSRQELGYDPRMGNPLGRTFEIGVKNIF